jgi:uncharacterized protein YecE (DUF72 family)
VRLLCGTSGYAFKEWKGSFYPEDIRADDMLGYYATRFPTVEINNTFYRLPKQNVLLEWAGQVPETFTFAVKASQRITHFARLKPEAKGPLDFLLGNTTVMGAKLGPILFQCPPNMRKNVDRLRAFLDLLPADRRFTFEFRDPSWFEDDVVQALREKNVELCVTDQDDYHGATIPTADWGYLRLHRFDYNESALGAWARHVAEQPWKEAYVYFKHDEGPTAVGSGPTAVDAFMRLASGL